MKAFEKWIDSNTYSLDEPIDARVCLRRVSQLLVRPQCKQRFGGALSSCAAQRLARLTALPRETLEAVGDTTCYWSN